MISCGSFLQLLLTQKSVLYFMILRLFSFLVYDVPGLAINVVNATDVPEGPPEGPPEVAINVVNATVRPTHTVVCSAEFAGDNCEECASGFYGFPNCIGIPPLLILGIGRSTSPSQHIFFH